MTVVQHQSEAKADNSLSLFLILFSLSLSACAAVHRSAALLVCLPLPDVVAAAGSQQKALGVIVQQKALFPLAFLYEIMNINY